MRSLQLIKTTRGATWALRQVKNLRELGVDVHVVLPDDDGLAPAYRAAGAHVHVLETDIARLKMPSTFLRARRAFRDLVGAVEPDVIHSHFVGTTLFMRAAMGRDGPVRIFQVPGPLHLENPVTRAVDIVSANARDRWIASCRFTKDVYLKAGIDIRRVGLSYYGLDLDRFRVSHPVDLRAQHQLSPETKIIGMVAYVYAPKRILGQTRGLKGHEDLIDAVALLIQQGRDLAVAFVGGPWNGAETYAAKLKEYAQRQLGNRAIFLGNRSDVANLYAGFNVAVHPSHSENLGGAVESLCLAVPTVATDVGGFPDIVIPGQTGWLASPRSPIDLARAIAHALDDPAFAKELAIQGASLVRHLLDVTRNAQEIASYYETFTRKGTA